LEKKASPFGLKLFMRNRLHYFLCLLLTAYCLLLTIQAQTPTVEKIEPPNWWANYSINPVRVLVRGTNFSGANVLSPNNSGLKAYNFRASENGHYLFFDVEIAPETKAGKYNFKIETKNGFADAPFEISEKLPRQNRFQGYTPDDVIYFLMPDRFADGDQSNNDPQKSKGLYDRAKTRFYHGGDLQGVIDKLPYLKSLGVTAIWTTPVYDNNDKPDYKEMYPNTEGGGREPTTGYHGYGATDLYAVEEHFGTMAKLHELVDKAHAIGLKVIQDQVANHTGPYHVWANDPPTATWWNGTVENHPNNNWQKWTAMNPRATRQTQSRNIDGWFVDILPDFNQSDPEVEKYLIQNSMWWLEMNGFDSIRMDTLPHVPRAFWEKWGTAIKREYPNVNILGELYDGDPALVAYFQTGRRGHDGVDTQIDTLFDYALFNPLRSAFANGQPIRGVSQMFAHDWLYPNADVLTTFIGNHDMLRFMSEKGATVEGLKLAQTLIMTQRGTPILYYADELAMRGAGDPDNRKDFPGGFAGDKQNAFTQKGRTAEENDVWNHIALLGKLRKELPALRTGKSLDLLDEEQQAVYSRVTDKQAVIVAFNNDTKPATIQFSVGDLKVIADGATLVDRLGKAKDASVKDGNVRVELPARYAAIYTVK
jgi:glycosidase